jgi:2-keto-4-pentenoate hydratase
MTSRYYLFAPLVGIFSLFMSSVTHSACLSDDQALDLVTQFVARQPTATPEDLSEEDGRCSRAKIHAILEKTLGPSIGYKAGLTNAAMQKRFKYDAPVWGRLYTGMLLKSGATVDVAFGARPLFEADLLVRVSSDDIKHARTPLQVLASIDQVIPFIELPDLIVQDPAKLTGPAISAVNAGARLGIVGRPILVPAMRAERYALLDSLRDMLVIVSDGSGQELSRGKGADILEHPLNAVVWLVQSLAKEGLALKQGDLISLGSFSALLPPRKGLSVAVTYSGLVGAEPVNVSFK